MNERITKIVIETLGKEGVIDSRAFGHWALSDEQFEKFAELIVRECAMFVVVELEGQVGSRIADATANRLEQHFGVKE